MKERKKRKKKYGGVNIARAFIIVLIDLIIAFGLGFFISVYLIFQLNIILSGI